MRHGDNLTYKNIIYKYNKPYAYRLVSVLENKAVSILSQVSLTYGKMLNIMF